MLPIAFGLLWAGYGVGSWGYVLVKGWNITLREWFSPLHPYTWPASGDPQGVPSGSVFPTAKTGGGAAGNSHRQATTAKPAQQQQPGPPPGTPPAMV